MSKLLPKTLIATFDVIGLFTNIKHNQGLESLENALNQRQKKYVPTDYLIKLMETILKNNIFEFHEANWKQEMGAAMGCPPP